MDKKKIVDRHRERLAGIGIRTQTDWQTIDCLLDMIADVVGELGGPTDARIVALTAERDEYEVKLAAALIREKCLVIDRDKTVLDRAEWKKLAASISEQRDEIVVERDLLLRGVDCRDAEIRRLEGLGRRLIDEKQAITTQLNRVQLKHCAQCELNDALRAKLRRFIP
jgi:hypothetical protein